MSRVKRKKQRKHWKYSKKFSREPALVGYIFLAVLLVFTMISKNPLLLFLMVTLFCSIINYQTNITTVRINPEPELFFSLLLTRVIGLKYSLIMLLIPTLFIDIYTARLDKDTFVSFILTIIINHIMYIFPTFNFLILGVTLVSIKFIAGLMINMAMNISIQEIFFEHIIGFVINLLTFLAFGNIILNLFI